MPLTIDQLIAEAETWIAAGYWVIAVNGKKSSDPNWNTRHVTIATLRRQLERIQAEGGEPGIAVVWGRTTRDEVPPLYDLEHDSPEQEAEARAILGDDFDKGTAFESSRGRHLVGTAPQEWAGLGRATVKFSSDLTLRIGGEKGAYSVVPPNVGRDFLPGRGLDQLRDAPDSLRYAVLEAIAESSATVQGAEYIYRPLSGEDFAAAKQWVLTLTPSVADQGGDDAVYNAMKKIVFRGGTDDQQHELALDYNAHCCSPSWGTGRLLRNLKRARDFVAGVEESRDLFTVIDDSLSLGNLQPSPILDASGKAFPRAADDDDLGPVITCYADMVKRYPVDLWLGRIGAEDMTLISGDPGVGKSFLTAGVTAVVSTGRNWPDGSPCSVGNVGIINFEDKADTVTIHRLEACGAAMSRVFDCTVTRKRDSRTREIINSPLVAQELGSIRKFVLSRQLRVLIVDPVGSFLGGNVDSYRDGEVRGVLMPLAQLAQELKFAVILIAHSTKGSAKNADANVMGSRAFTGVCRTVLHTMLDPTDHDHILLLPGKRNSSKKAPGIGYRIEGEPGVVVWDKDVTDLTTFDILQAEQEQRRPRTTSQQIWAFLDAQLKDGPRSRKDVMLAAMANHFVESSVSTAIRKKEIEQYDDDDGDTMLRIGARTIVGVQE